jgi:hypothetical protein
MPVKSGTTRRMSVTKTSPEIVGTYETPFRLQRPNNNIKEKCIMIQEGRHRKNPRDKGRFRGGTIAAGVLMTALLLTLLPASGGAHPPKEVLLSYDQANKTLEVRITHGVSDPTKHFIERVEISKAGKTISKTEYPNQPGETTFAYSYPLDAAPGDLIEVKASCSVFGSKTGKLTVGK